MRHLVGALGLVILSRVFGLSQMEAAGFGATAVVGFETYQGLTHSGSVELRDVGTGLVGVALVSLVPDRKAPVNVVTLNPALWKEIDRVGLAIQCDLVRRDSTRVVPRNVCR